MNVAKRSASTSSVVEGDGSLEISGECDFQPQKFRSIGKEHNTLEKSKSKKKEPEVNGIIHEATK